MISRWARALVVVGGISGLAGVALSALAAHATGPGSLDVAARFLLIHAPVFLAVAALLAAGVLHPGLGRAAAVALAVGLALFSGDLALRALAGAPLAPLAAPVGGFVLMAGWALLAGAPLMPRRPA